MDVAECTVHIVDDEEAVRKSLSFLLATAGFAVRVYDGAIDFLAAAPGLQHGCLVTDLRMPGMDGVELLNELKDAGIAIPSIVITGHADVPMAVKAMKAGALDFIEKPFEDEVLIAALLRATEHVDAPEGRIGNVAEIQVRLDQLTDRERQVFSSVVLGLPNKRIAFDLGISPRTVEVHRASVMAKMQARSLPELVRMALTVDASRS